MKRITLALITTVLLTLTLALPVSADAPNYEDWQFFSARNGQAYGYYHINTTNLKVDYFTLVNNTSIDTLHMYVIYDKGGSQEEILLEMTCLPNSTVSEDIKNFFFRRMPASDPDDPDSIRYPNKVTMHCGN